MSKKDFIDGMNKKETKLKVKSIVDPKPMEVWFTSKFLTRLFIEKKESYIKKNIIPIEFRKSYTDDSGLFRGNYVFYIKDTNGIERISSWRKCIYPENIKTTIKKALRLSIQDIIYEYKDKNKKCNICGKKATEVDHIDPQFNILATGIFLHHGEKHWQALYNSHPENIAGFTLASNHPAVEHIRSLHIEGYCKMQSLCSECHHMVTSKRKKMGLT